MPTTAKYLEAEIGFVGGAARDDQGTTSSATRTNATPSGRYLRLIGGPLYREPGGPRARALSQDAARHGRLHPHHHQLDDHGCLDHDMAVNDGEMIASVDAETPADGGGERLLEGPLRGGQAPVRLRVHDGPRAPSPLEQRPESQGYEDTARGSRRRICTKTKPAGERTATGQPASVGESTSDGPQAEPRCSLLASGSWAARLSACATSNRSECNTCGTYTRTRCRGCLRPLCIACARNSVTCGG